MPAVGVDVADKAAGDIKFCWSANQLETDISNRLTKHSCRRAHVDEVAR